MKQLLKNSRKICGLIKVKNFTKKMNDLLDKHSVTLYSTENEEKSCFVERWNRRIKTKMWGHLTIQCITQYLDMLSKLVKECNNTKHSSIRMTTIEASKKNNEGTFYFNLYGDMEQVTSKPKLEIGDLFIIIIIIKSFTVGEEKYFSLSKVN